MNRRFSKTALFSADICLLSDISSMPDDRDNSANNNKQA